MSIKYEYVNAAVDRIKDWCKSNSCEIPNIAYVAILCELIAMYEYNSSNDGNRINKSVCKIDYGRQVSAMFPNANRPIPREALAGIMNLFDLYVQYSISD